MMRFRSRSAIPPGLMAQIVIALLITLGALLVLPSTLSARETPTVAAITAMTPVPHGRIETTVRPFLSAEFQPAAFSDWDDRR